MREVDIDILGALWRLVIENRTEDSRLADCDGLCDDSVRELCVADLRNDPGASPEKADLGVVQQKVIRHEIIHAFLCESGLAECSDWAQNEELVDWFARQGPKIYRAWIQADAVPETIGEGA